MKFSIPSRLCDSELVAEVKRLARCEREASVSLIAHLAELDARRLYLGAGFPSLFAYCTEVLHLSEYGTYNRIEAARTARRFPVILDMLSDGSLNLATARLLAPHLTSENHHTLLEAASGRSKREVEELIVRYFPRPGVPPLIRKLPERFAAAASSAVPPDAQGDESALTRLDGAATPSQASGRSDAAPPLSLRPPARSTPTPLAPDRYQIRFTASAETCRKLRQVQELLGHAVPDGNPAAIFDRALTALLDDLTRKKFAATERPRAGNVTTPGSRHIPAKVRRGVWRRDGGRCAFVGMGGNRCAARKCLEFHHVQPYCAGGEATIRNIQLRCRAHNAYEARLFSSADRPGPTRPGASSATH